MTETSPIHVLIATGGTGGHVYPALAVADELLRRGVQVSWMGTRKGMESKILADKSIPLYFISVSGLRGKGLAGWLLAPFKLTFAILQAVTIIKKHKPNVVLGMGGFVSGPGGLASWLLRKPLVIHEQNTIAGMTNKALSKIASRVAQAFPGTFNENIKPLYVGNPLRADIEKITPPNERFNNRADAAINILVLGGSLGAKALNETLPGIFKSLDTSCLINIRHQTGLKHLESAQQVYRRTGVKAEVVDYIEDMSEAYQWADLVICRSGALTVSEIAAVGLAAIFIPYPYAVDDHQYFNAKFLADSGAAKIIRQSELKSNELMKLLDSLVCHGREKLIAMAKNAGTCAMPDAAVKVADLCCELARPSKRGIVNG